MRAKILFTAVAVLNERIRLDGLRIDGLEKSKSELKTALALCEDIASNNKKIITDYEGIMKNNRKKQRNRVIYFGAGGLAVGLITGLIISR